MFDCDRRTAQQALLHTFITSPFEFDLVIELTSFTQTDDRPIVYGVLYTV